MGGSDGSGVRGRRWENGDRMRRKGNMSSRGGKKRVEVSRYALGYQQWKGKQQNGINSGKCKDSCVSPKYKDDNNTSDSDNIKKTDGITNHDNSNNGKETNRNQICETVGSSDMHSPGDEMDIMRLMGFAGFGTTKGKAVEDNQIGPAKGGARIEKGPRKYRQYMNRLGKNKFLDNDAIGSRQNKII